MLSATPKLSSLLHTYFKKSSELVPVAGSRRINVQPTAMSRHRDGAPRGNMMATGGRPVKRLHPEPDVLYKINVAKKDHVKRKQNLRKNELKNQANQFKHGRGH